ncbi:MAG: hypothetical protein WDO13_07840 [Verrucomicrobiota bacterium]
MRQKIDLLVRKVFGAEQREARPGQLDLLLTGTENAPGKANASSPVEEADPQQSRHRPGPKDKRASRRSSCHRRGARSRGSQKRNRSSWPLHRPGGE